MKTPVYILSEQGITVLAEKIWKKIEQLKMTEMKQEIEQETFIDIIKVTELLQLSKQTIYGLVNRRKIPYYKRGKKLYFLKNQIIEWVISGKSEKKNTNEQLNQFLSKKSK